MVIGFPDREGWVKDLSAFSTKLLKPDIWRDSVSHKPLVSYYRVYPNLGWIE